MKSILMVFCGLAGVVMAAEPTVTITSVKQNDDESVEVAYTLSGAEAVVTMDALQGGVSIGDAALWAVEGDVNQKVEPGEGHTIKWFPDLSWPGHKYDETSILVKLRAWPLDDTPDYMVVDLAPNTSARICYYTSTNAIPGGLMQQEYRISKMVFRKIKAKGITWKMGPNSAQHDVTLDHNYYLGVFELTAGQHMALGGGGGYFGGVEYQMRALDSRDCTGIRGRQSDCSYPNPPGDKDAKGTKSVLSTLRALVGDPDGSVYDFDFPSEAEWEFAARGGHGNGFWGDGSPVNITDGVDANLSRIARYAKNNGLIGGTKDPYNTVNFVTGPTNGVAIVGNYAPNSYGLYDMSGNEYEYCLDVYKADITADGGAIITGGESTQDRVVRGGAYNNAPATCAPSYRGKCGWSYSAGGGGYGFRFVCHAGLK